MDFQCKTGKAQWYGTVAMLDGDSDLFFAQLTGRSSEIHVIGGTEPTGQRFLCIPNYDVGCHLADPKDTFWNKEKLAPLLGEIDAATVAYGLKQIDLLLSPEQEMQPAHVASDMGQ